MAIDAGNAGELDGLTTLAELPYLPRVKEVECYGTLARYVCTLLAAQPMPYLVSLHLCGLCVRDSALVVAALQNNQHLTCLTLKIGPRSELAPHQSEPGLLLPPLPQLRYLSISQHGDDIASYLPLSFGNLSSMTLLTRLHVSTPGGWQQYAVARLDYPSVAMQTVADALPFMSALRDLRLGDWTWGGPDGSAGTCWLALTEALPHLTQLTRLMLRELMQPRDSSAAADRAFSEAVSGLTSLRRLYICGGTTIDPDALPDLDAEQVAASAQVACAIGKLTALETLELRWCRYLHPQDCFEHFSSLQLLDRLVLDHLVPVDSPPEPGGDVVVMLAGMTPLRDLVLQEVVPGQLAALNLISVAMPKLLRLERFLLLALNHGLDHGPFMVLASQLRELRHPRLTHVYLNAEPAEIDNLNLFGGHGEVFFDHWGLEDRWGFGDI